MVLVGLAARRRRRGDAGPRVRVQGGLSRRPFLDARGRGARLLRADRLRGLGEPRRRGSEPEPRLPACALRRPADRWRIFLARDRLASMVVPTAHLAASDGPLLEVVQPGPLEVPTGVLRDRPVRARQRRALLASANRAIAEKTSVGTLSGPVWTTSSSGPSEAASCDVGTTMDATTVTSQDRPSPAIRRPAEERTRVVALGLPQPLRPG